ncbi:MAG: AAA family ATPase [Leptospirales bacterium]|nr:AAA family ATPase [Leptospirales bacterium]
MNDFRPLSADQLFRAADPQLVGFETTELVEGLPDGFGQERAQEAIRFALGIDRPGYNLYVLGDAGSGRHTAVRMLLESRAGQGAQPEDWVYVNNFGDPGRPLAISLPAGRGAQFRADLRRFVTELNASVNAGFESERYTMHIEAIQREYKDREEAALRELGRTAAEQGVALLRTPQGFIFTPMKGEEPMDPGDLASLSEEERERIGKLIEGFRDRLQALLRQFPRWQSEMQQRVREAGREALQLAVAHLVDALKEKYAELPTIISYLNEVMSDVVESGEELRGREGPRSEADLAALLLSGRVTGDRYQANLIVDRDGESGPPVVFEDNPGFSNLVGRLEHIIQFGASVTGYSFIRAGALHRANGGYLILDAARVLAQPFSWDALKRALKSGQIRIESENQALGLGASLPIEPLPIPLKLKVILIGNRTLYYLLREADPEFDELFKVAADFEADMPRTPENEKLFARMVATLAARQELLPLHRSAVTRLIEHGARRAGGADRLSLQTRWISDLMAEAEHLATADGQTMTLVQHVDQALQAQRRRNERIPQRMQELISRGIVRIETEGAQIGQVNGLAVLSVGEMLSAHPVRITATARVGEGGVVDIERETELGGALHSKGVLILSSFLGARYSPAQPLALSASLVFEQSYGPVEGDSASLAELCALLSALSGVAIQQRFAVTGSVDQYGSVQAIGAVNEKIEGFFDVCLRRGLTGDQGVLIPSSNVQQLMLRSDLREAAAEGRFQVYAVSHVDEAIELLTGMPAGVQNEQGDFSDSAINGRVIDRLRQMLEARQQSTRPEERQPTGP